MKTDQIRKTDSNGVLILPDVFTAKGFLYTQKKRVGMKAIYEVSYMAGKSKSYEVIKIQAHNGYEIAGTKIPASEVYPSSEQWGIFGWTLPDLISAENKFYNIL